MQQHPVVERSGDHTSAFWASCLQVFSIRICIQNAPCLLPACSEVSFVFRLVILHKVLPISGKRQGTVGNPLELRKAAIRTLQSFLWETLRIYLFLPCVSSRHKLHISNEEKVLWRSALFLFSSFKSSCCNWGFQNHLRHCEVTSEVFGVQMCFSLKPQVFHKMDA